MLSKSLSNLRICHDLEEEDRHFSRRILSDSNLLGKRNGRLSSEITEFARSPREHNEDMQVAVFQMEEDRMDASKSSSLIVDCETRHGSQREQPIPAEVNLIIVGNSDESSPPKYHLKIIRRPTVYEIWICRRRYPHIYAFAVEKTEDIGFVWKMIFRIIEEDTLKRKKPGLKKRIANGLRKCLRKMCCCLWNGPTLSEEDDDLPNMEYFYFAS